MTERPLSEMSDEEIIDAISQLRERRAVARERRVAEKTAEGDKPVKKKEGKVSDALWDLLEGSEEETT